MSGTTSTCGYCAWSVGEGLLVDVGDDDAGAVLEQVAGQDAPDLADAGDADGAALEGRLAPQVLGAGALALEDAVGGEHRGVAGAAVGLRAAGGEAGRLAHDVHVGDVGAHVARRDVAAAEATRRSGRRRAAARASCRVAGSPMMTALPPPRSRPATAFL